MIKKIISLLLGFILTINIIIILLITILNNTILKEDYITSTLDNQKYYQKTRTATISNLEGYIMSTGLDKEVLSNIITEDIVKEHIQGLIHSVYQNKDYQIDTSFLNDGIDQSIQAKIQETGQKLTKEDNQNIAILKTTLTSAYIDSVDYLQSHLKTVKDYYQKASKILNTATPILYGTLALLCLIIILIWRKPKPIINYLITPLLSSGILFIILDVILHNRFNKVLIFTREFTDVLLDILHNICNLLFTYGLIISIISIVILLISPKESLKCSTSNKK